MQHPDLAERDLRLFGSGVLATDLAAVWMLFDEPSEVAAAYKQILEATWERARRWAIHFGLMAIDSGDRDDPAWAEAGRRTLETAC
ncbi:MAG: hypothetical protein GY926_20345 [bacterium]|nr:hypothetical protein [bacterium]